METKTKDVFQRYRVTRITIKGKGSTTVNRRTSCLSSLRKEIARDNKVAIGDVDFTYVDYLSR